MPVAIIKCGMCESKFDVSGFEAGTTIKCGKCKSLLEVPVFRHRHQSSVMTLDAPTTKREIKLDAPLPEIPKKKDREKKAKEKEKDKKERGKTTARSKEEVTQKRRKPERTERRRRDETKRRTTRRVAPEDLGRKEGKSASLPVIGGVGVVVVLAIVLGLAFSGGGKKDPAKGPTVHEPSNADLFDDKYLEAGSDTGKLWELAGWCEDKKLESRRHKVLLQIVRLEPNHTAANKALGRVRHEDKWIAKEKYDAIRKRLEPAMAVLGKKVYRSKHGQFDVLIEKGVDQSDEMAVEGEKRMVAVFTGQLDDYLKGFWERMKEDLYSYSSNRRGKRFRKPADLPRRTLAVFTNKISYENAAKKLEPRAIKERGWFDRKTQTIYLFHDGTNDYGSTFYDTFLFDTYFGDDKSNPNIFILWEKGMRSLKYLGKGVDVSLSKHFLVAVETGKGYSAKLIAKNYTDKLEVLYDTFARDFKSIMDTRKKMQMMPIYIFKERDGYLRYGKKTNKLHLLMYAGGHYEPNNRIMMTFRRRGQFRTPTVLHEGTHLLMHYLSNFKAKKAQDLFWFQEGIADYYAGFIHKDGKLVLGYPNQTRLEHFKPRVHQAYALKDFVRYSQMTWARVVSIRNPRAKHTAMMQVYTQGWALCHFLMHGAGGKYRKKFLKFIDSALRGGQTFKDFERCFGSIDYNTMQKEFVRYILNLHI